MIKRDTDEKLSAIALRLRLAYTRYHFNEMINTVTEARRLLEKSCFIFLEKKLTNEKPIESAWPLWLRTSQEFVLWKDLI